MQRPVELPISESDWRRTPASVQALVVSLWERVQTLERRVAELEHQLQSRSRGRASGPSSSQPSASSSEADESTSRPRSSSRRRSSGRSPGGQPGHEGHGHAWLEADDTFDVTPSSCRRCGRALRGDGIPTRRHQTIEIPPVRPRVTEYRLHAVRCAHCDLLTESELPEGVPRSAFGASVHGWVGLLSGGYRTSKRHVKALLADAFGLDLAEGTVWQLEQTVSEAVAAPVDDAQAHVQQQAAVNVDETSFREGKLIKWLWTAVTDQVTVFAIRLSRGREVVRELLGEPGAAVVGSDRYVAYGDLPTGQRQLCWAHVIRNWEAFLERGGTAARVGEALLEHAHQLFTWWHRVRDGTLQRSSFQTYVADLRQSIRVDLWYGQWLGDAKTAATCRELLAVEPALYTFVRHPGVQPTNNSAERALRHGVIWRKTSFGTKTEAGSRYVERMLTVRETLRQQNRSMLDYLTQACQAAFRHTAPPSLLP